MALNDGDNAKLELERERLRFEHEKWAKDCQFRQQELDLSVAEHRNRESELLLKRQEYARAGWWNPLVVAVFAAALAGVGNAVVSTVNGIQERGLENQKAEQARILEMIKTGNTETAAGNLSFLLSAGLIDDQDRRKKIEAFLKSRGPGGGPVLPSSSVPARSSVGGTETKLYFINDGDASVDVFWLDYSGREQKYATISPGQRYEQNTYAAHPWTVRRKDNGALLLSVVASKDPQVVRIPASH